MEYLLWSIAVVLLGAAVWVLTALGDYDVEALTGSMSPTLIDDKLQQVLGGLQEILAVDHQFELNGTVVDDADSGKHNKVSLPERLAKPDHSEVTDEGALYTKDDAGSSKAQLFWEDEEQHEKMITTGDGALNIASSEVPVTGALEDGGSNIQVKADGITGAMLNNNVADGINIQVGTNELEIVPGSLDTLELANDCITPGKVDVPTKGTDADAIAVPVIVWGTYVGTGDVIDVKVADSATYGIRHLVIRCENADKPGVEGIRNGEYQNNGIMWTQDSSDDGTGKSDATGAWIDMSPAAGANYFRVNTNANAGDKLNKTADSWKYAWMAILEWAT